MAFHAPIRVVSDCSRSGKSPGPQRPAWRQAGPRLSIYPVVVDDTPAGAPNDVPVQRHAGGAAIHAQHCAVVKLCRFGCRGKFILAPSPLIYRHSRLRGNDGNDLRTNFRLPDPAQIVDASSGIVMALCRRGGSREFVPAGYSYRDKATSQCAK